MTDMRDPWGSWASYHKTNGFEIERFLNPAADPISLGSLEREIGHGLPEDLRTLWSIADGQMDIFDIADPSPGRILSPVPRKWSRGRLPVRTPEVRLGRGASNRLTVVRR